MYSWVSAQHEVVPSPGFQYTQPLIRRNKTQKNALETRTDTAYHKHSGKRGGDSFYGQLANNSYQDNLKVAGLTSFCVNTLDKRIIDSRCFDCHQPITLLHSVNIPEYQVPTLTLWQNQISLLVTIFPDSRRYWTEHHTEFNPLKIKRQRALFKDPVGTAQ